MVVNPKNTIYGAKRLIGRKSNSRVVQELRSYFSYDIVEGPNGEAAVLLGGTRLHAAADQRHGARAPEEDRRGLPGREPSPRPSSRCRPTTTTTSGRRCSEAGKLAGFEVQAHRQRADRGGAGLRLHRAGWTRRSWSTTWAAAPSTSRCCSCNGNVFEVLATGGDTFLGGVDFDNRIIDFVLEDFWRAHQIDLRRLAHRHAAGQERGRGGEDRPVAHPQRGHRAALHRGAQGQAARPARAAVARAAQRADRATWSTGPSSSATRCWARRGCSARGHRRGDPGRRPEPHAAGAGADQAHHFGKPPRKGVHPDECVALGAALLGDSLRQIDSVTLVDVLSMPIGIGIARRPVPQGPRQEHAPSPPSAASACRRLQARGAASRWTSSRATPTTSSTTSTWAR